MHNVFVHLRYIVYVYSHEQNMYYINIENTKSVRL